jgi:hypothetical protein
MPEIPEEARWILKVPGMRQRLGLGDLVEKATKKMGFTPCSACQNRKQFLNKVVFE